MKENLEYEEEFLEEKESDWLPIVFFNNKCLVLNLKENDKNFEFTPRKDCTTHSTLDICLQSNNFSS